MSGNAGRHDESTDHHHPHDGRGGGAPALVDALGEQHQQRRSGGADAESDHEEGDDGERNSSGRIGCHPRRRERRRDAADCEQAHAADDPRRPPLADVGAVAEPRPQQLDGVMKRDQRAGKHRRHGELDHHHPVQRRGRQHHDGAERGLHQAEPDDAEPSERFAAHHGAPAMTEGSANALTSMPRT